MSDLEIGVGRGELAGKVILKAGEQYITLTPRAARAYAIHFLLHAEKAEQPPEQKPDGKALLD